MKIAIVLQSSKISQFYQENATVIKEDVNIRRKGKIQYVISGILFINRSGRHTYIGEKLISCVLIKEPAMKT